MPVGPLPDHWVSPCPAFHSFAEDLFGSIEYQGTKNNTQTGKGQEDYFCMHHHICHSHGVRRGKLDRQIYVPEGRCPPRYSQTGENNC
jgi:hypothetical protein